MFVMFEFKTNLKSTCPTIQAFGRTSSKTCSSQLLLQRKKENKDKLLRFRSLREHYLMHSPSMHVFLKKKKKRKKYFTLVDIHVHFWSRRNSTLLQIDFVKNNLKANWLGGSQWLNKNSSEDSTLSSLQYCFCTTINISFISSKKKTQHAKKGFSNCWTVWKHDSNCLATL